MTVENEDEQAGRTSGWTWIAAGIAVLFGQVVLMAVGAMEDEGPLTVVAAVLVVVGLVRGAMNWRNRRGR